MIEITLANNRTVTIRPGTTLLELMDLLNLDPSARIVVGKVNNKVVDLYYVLDNDCQVEFLDMTTNEGVMAYYRSLTFVLATAVEEMMPNESLVIDHSISKGLYCHFKREYPLSEREVAALENRMREIISSQSPFIRHTYSKREAIKKFQETQQYDKVRLLKTILRKNVNLYTLDNNLNYFYGPLVPSTSYLYSFKLHSYPPGFILRFPHQSDPEQLPLLEMQPRLFSILQEHEEWGRILGVEDASHLNEIISQKNFTKFIQIAEALHVEKLIKIAENISKRGDDCRVILIAGPSSSGKTTFLKRLDIQLRVHGKKPVMLSVDDYFVERERTPRDAKGNFDFEAINAIDLPMLNDHLLKLMDFQKVEIPKFDFAQGRQIFNGHALQLEKNGIIIIEGIHCLNDELTPMIPLEYKFKIYISALTFLNIDNHNRIPTSDTRLLRRIVRDMRTRNYSPLDTIRRWPSVRAGEERNIFPYQEEADIMFNSALFYELAVLKTIAEPLLHAHVPRTEPEYSEARRLLKFLSYFRPLKDNRAIPADSILREFIGKSIFQY